MSEKKGATELTPDLLELVSGGVMTDTAENVLHSLIVALKKDTAATHTADEATTFVIEHLMDNKLLTGVTTDDVKEYFATNWELVQAEE